MSNANQEPAFPTPYNDYPHGIQKTEYLLGITKRDYFAGIALQGVITSSPFLNSEDAAKKAVEHADAIIKALGI